MQVVGFFGGKGTRSRPAVAAPIQKHLITIGNLPLIGHVIQTISKAGASKIYASLNGQHPDQTMQTITGLKQIPPVAYTYSQEDPEEVGPLYDLARMKPWLTAGEPFAVVNGDTYFHDYTVDFAEVTAPHLWTTPVPNGADPSQFGQVVTDGSRVTSLVEKPDVQQSQLISTGFAVLPYDALDLAIDLCQNAEPGQEMHIAFLLAALVKQKRVEYTIIPSGHFYDCGTAEAINAASNAAWQAHIEHKAAAQ